MRRPLGGALLKLINRLARLAEQYLRTFPFP